MEMKLVRFARRQLGANEHQIGVAHHARFAMPIVGFAGKTFDVGFLEGNKTPAWQLFICHTGSLEDPDPESSEMNLGLHGLQAG